MRERPHAPFGEMGRREAAEYARWFASTVGERVGSLVARVEKFTPILHRLKKRGVVILLNTKPLEEHDEIYKLQAQESLSLLQSAGIEVLFTVKHHRKLAIIDREIIYEGSLNILSYRDSCEIMRRMTSALEAEMLIDFIGLNKFMEVK